MSTHVKAHLRRSSRGNFMGVRAYVRGADRTLPYLNRGNRWEHTTVRKGGPNGEFVLAFTDVREPGRIYLNHLPEPNTVEYTMTPRQTPEKLISHETLHDVLNRIGEPQASFALDKRWSRFGMYQSPVYLNNGMPVYVKGKPAEVA